MTATEQAMSRLYWAMAVTKRLHATAFAERRFEDANYYAKFIESLELEAEQILNEETAS